MPDVDEVLERAKLILKNNIEGKLQEIANERGDGKTPTVIREFMDSVSYPRNFPTILIEEGKKQIQYEGTRFPVRFPLIITCFDHNPDDDVGVQRLGAAVERVISDHQDLNGMVPGTKFNSTEPTAQRNLGFSTPPIRSWSGIWAIYLTEEREPRKPCLVIDKSLSLRTYGSFQEKGSINSTIANTPIFAVNRDYVKTTGEIMSSNYPSRPTSTGNPVAAISSGYNLIGNNLNENQDINHLLIIDNLGNIHVKNDLVIFRSLGSGNLLEIAEDNGNVYMEGRFISAPLNEQQVFMVFWDNGDIVLPGYLSEVV